MGGGKTKANTGTKNYKEDQEIWSLNGWVKNRCSGLGFFLCPPNLVKGSKISMLPSFEICVLQIVSLVQLVLIQLFNSDFSCGGAVNPLRF